MHWPADFRSSSQAAICLPLAVKVLHCSFSMVIVKQESCEYLFFRLCFDRPGIELTSTVSVKDALTLIDKKTKLKHILAFFIYRIFFKNQDLGLT